MAKTKGRKPAVRAGVFIIVVVGAVIGFKILTAPGAPAGIPEHITIAEAVGEKAGEVVKVGGDVEPGSIGWDDASGLLRFTLTGEGDSLRVEYPGPAPGDFKPGMSLVAEGIYANGGIFEATSLTSRSSPLCKACHR